MHELSVISSIIELVKTEIAKMDNVSMVKEVHLSVGDLTFLGHEQLRFGYENLTRSEPNINSEGLVITSVPSVVKCRKCDYEGPLHLEDSEEYHFSLPVFACPKCEGRIDIVSGKECTITNLVVDTEGE